MTTFYANRSALSARTDEDAAMARQQQGPFQTAQDAHDALIAMVAKELAWCVDRADRYAATQQSWLDAAKELVVALAELSDGLSADTDTIRWSVTNVA